MSEGLRRGRRVQEVLATCHYELKAERESERPEERKAVVAARGQIFL